MVITKSEDVTKQGFCKILWGKLCLRESLLLSLIWVCVGGRRNGGGRLFEAGRWLALSGFRMGAYSRWALIRGWAIILINTVIRSIQKLWLLYINAEENDEAGSISWRENVHFTLYLKSTLHFVFFIWVCLSRREHELYWTHNLFILTWRWCFFDRRQTVSYAQESSSHLALTSRYSSILAIGGHYHAVVNTPIDVWFVGSGEGPPSPRH